MGTFHQSAYSATSAMVLAPVPPITMGSRPSGVGSWRAPVTSKCVPWWSTGSPDQNPRSNSSVSRSRSIRWAPLGRTESVRGQLGRRRPRPDAQVEPPAGQVVEGDRLPGQDGRVAEGVAEDQVPEPKPFGDGGQPGDRGQRLVHRLVGRSRGEEVVHHGQPGETGLLGRLGPGPQGLR